MANKGKNGKRARRCLYYHHDGEPVQERIGVENDCGGHWCCYYDIGSGKCARPDDIPPCGDRIYYADRGNLRELKKEKRLTAVLLGRMRRTMPYGLWTKELEYMIRGRTYRTLLWSLFADVSHCGTRYMQYAHAVWMAVLLDRSRIDIREKARFGILLLRSAGLEQDKMFKETWAYLWNVMGNITAFSEMEAVRMTRGKIDSECVEVGGVRLVPTMRRRLELRLNHMVLMVSRGNYFALLLDTLRELVAEDAPPPAIDEKASIAALQFLDAARTMGNPFHRGRDIASWPTEEDLKDDAVSE